MRLRLLAAVALVALPAYSLPSEKDAWHEIRSDHFTLVGNGDPKITAEVARRVETLRSALAVLTPEVPLQTPRPATVFVFRDPASLAPYARYLGREVGRPASYLRSAEYADFLVVTGADSETLTAGMQSYLARLIRASFPSAPAWVVHGLASAYSTVSVADGKVRVGPPVVEYALSMRSAKPIPFETLFSMHEPKSSNILVVGGSTFEAESWAACHYLFVGSEPLRAKAVSFLVRVARGENAKTAWDSAVGLPLSDLDPALAAYVRQDRMAFFAIPTEKMPRPSIGAATPLSRKDALVRLGSLLGSLEPDRAGEAEAHFRAALAVDPAFAPALAGIAWLRSRDGKYEEAAKLYDDAIARGSDDPLVPLLAARNLLAGDRASRGAFETSPSLPEPVSRARSLLEAYVAAHPTDAEALGTLGATYIPDPGDVGPGIAALESSMRLQTPRADVLLNLLTLYGRKGEREKAEALIAGPIAELEDPKTEQIARERLAFADFAAVNAKIAEGDLEGALAALREARPRATSSAVRERIDSEIARIEPVAKKNRLVAQYNEAVARFNKGDRKGAAELLDAILAAEPDEEMRGLAEGLLKKAK